LGVHAIVIAGVVRGGGVADADRSRGAAPAFQPAARHVLHLGDLIDDLTDAVEHEIGEQ